MSESCVILNSIFYLQLFVTDSDGNAKTGLTTSYVIYKSNDDSLISSGNLVDSGNGVYKSSYIFNVLGQFYIIYTTPSSYTNEIETVLVQNETAKANDLARLLGLSDENKKIFNTVHDSNGNLLTADIKIYSTANDFENDTNILATYSFTATYNTTGLMQTMGIKRTS